MARKKVEKEVVELSEEEQPYELPEGWKWTRLGDIAQWGSGGTPSRKHPEYYTGDICWVKTGELNDGYIYSTEEHITDDAIANSSARLYDKNTVIMAMYGATIGKVAILGVKATTNQACACATCYNDIYNKFLFYYLRSQKQNFIELGKGGAQPNISKKVILEYHFPLPPKRIQQKIVDIIESLFTKLDIAQEKVEQVLAESENRRSAILHNAFSGKLTEKWREDNGVSFDSWRNISLSYLLYPMTSKKPVGKFFRYIDIDSIDNTIQEIKIPKIIEVDKAPSRASRAVHCDDVIFSMVRPYLKNIAYINSEFSDCIASTGFYVCTCKREISPYFLFRYLCSKDAIDYLMQFMKGDNSPSIRKNDFLGMIINLPTLSEQKEIVRLLDKFLSVEDKVRSTCQNTLESIATMRKSILAKAFRGELCS